jgi:hypothetical protein
MKKLVMTWNTEDGRLACRWRELESEKVAAASIPQALSDEPSSCTFRAIRRSGSSVELGNAA